MTDVSPTGDYTSDWKATKDTNPEFKCRECGSNDIVFREWESSCGGYEDYQYHCRGCDRKWWVEGADA